MVEDWQYEDYEDDVELANGSYGNIDSFMEDYFYDNAELQSEYDYDLLDEYKYEIFAKWQELVGNGENDWTAAEIAANEVLPNSTDKHMIEKFGMNN